MKGLESVGELAGAAAALMRGWGIHPARGKTPLVRKSSMEQVDLPLSGVHVFIVEDEMLVALAIEDMITELGGDVASIATRLEQAFAALDEADIDCAILDVNLSGTLSYPIAKTLRRRNIPFLYCTAYADAVSVFPPIAAAPRLAKPVHKDELRDALLRILRAPKM
jgi:two-component SAPR family response regulator